MHRDVIIEMMPERVRNALNRSRKLYESMTELHIRVGGAITITVDGENYILNRSGASRLSMEYLTMTQKEIDGFIEDMCDGSVYAYEETIKKGYISAKGVRLGVCGSFALGNVMRISSVNIRIPKHIEGCAQTIVDYISKNGFSGNAGLLVASAPGVGKTTVLRELARIFSKGIVYGYSATPKVYRVCVVDERYEIYMPEVFKGCAVDFCRGLDKGSAIEICTRVMAPEIIICDEIGSERESGILASTHAGGIKIIASVHAETLKEILSKTETARLCEKGVFSHICFLYRKGHGVQTSIYSIEEDSYV